MRLWAAFERFGTEQVLAARALGELKNWCGSQLPQFQWPQYLEFVEGFELTGTERIRKETLSKSIDSAHILDLRAP